MRHAHFLPTFGCFFFSPGKWHLGDFWNKKVRTHGRVYSLLSLSVYLFRNLVGFESLFPAVSTNDNKGVIATINEKGVHETVALPASASP
jgi:hypothetical protein